MKKLIKSSYTKSFLKNFLFAILVFLTSLFVVRPYAEANAQSAIKPLGNPSATQGGIAYYNLLAEPTTLNPITTNDAEAATVLQWVVESLLNINPQTHDWMPALAKSWSISPNGKVFTFVLRKGATFSDGTPVTIQDVKFSFDVIFNKTYNAANLIPYYQDIAKAVITGPQTIKFFAKTRYWGNFNALANLSILPKHVYGDAQKGIKLNHSVVGSGPYMIEHYYLGNRIILKRNPNWWGNKVPLYKGWYNMKQIVYRFISNKAIQVASVRSHDLTELDATPEQFVRLASGPGWKKAVVKEKVKNLSPKSTWFVAWNLHKPSSPNHYIWYAFRDRRVRLALAHLMDRKTINKKLLYDMEVRATGPFYRQSIYASPKVKPIDYDPQLAQKLLHDAGWTDLDHDGILAKVIKGKKIKFHFTLLYPLASSEKYFTMYQQELKRVGIQMQLRLVDWSSFVKLLDEHKFDAVTLKWTGSIDPDPTGVWSSSGTGPNGDNFIDYRNPEVDRLIAKSRSEMNRAKRIEILRRVYELIADDAPYLFLFNEKYSLYMHSPKLQMVQPTFRYALGRAMWWLSP